MNITNPDHYKTHDSGIECIEISQQLSFCLGNAFKYVWRAGLKPDNSAANDLLKALWYIRREAKIPHENALIYPLHNEPLCKALEHEKGAKQTALRAIFYANDAENFMPHQREGYLIDAESAVKIMLGQLHHE